MSAALRKALFWLLVLVLPLHGLAAASMMLPHVRAQGVMQMPESALQRSQLNMDAGTVAAQAAEDCAGMPASCDHPHAAGVLKCGLSAACGLVAAPALQMPSLLQPGSSRAPVPMRTRLRVAFCTGAPERPPRLLA